MKLLRILAMILILPTAASAQSDGATVAFNLLTLEGVTVDRVFTFDAAYTEKFGIPVPAPFRVEIPIHDEVELIADGKPDGGFVKFTFATREQTRRFIENFHVVDMTIGMSADAADPLAARLQTLAQVVEKQALPMATQGFSDVRMIGIRRNDFNGVPSVELVATYTDPSVGPMVLQLAGLLNPDAPESYLVVHNLSLTTVPMASLDELPQSLGGRVLASFEYR